MRYTFTRRDGSRFALDITVDHDKLAETLARKIAFAGRASKLRTTIAGGAIVAIRTELD